MDIGRPTKRAKVDTPKDEEEVPQNTLDQSVVSLDDTKEETKDKDRFSVSKDGLVILGLTLVAGVLIGSSIKSN